MNADKLEHAVRRTLIPGVAALLTATICAPAFAHGRLIGSSPRAGATVSPPSTMRLDFSEAIEPRLAKVSVLCANREIAKGFVTAKGAASLEVALDPAPAGLCEARWSAVSVDGHRTQGAFSFTSR